MEEEQGGGVEEESIGKSEGVGDRRGERGEGRGGGRKRIKDRGKREVGERKGRREIEKATGLR